MSIVCTLGLENKFKRTLREKFQKMEIIHIDQLAELTEEELAKVEILFTYGDHMPEAIVEKMVSLKWVHSGQSGIEAMPQAVLSKKGVFVTNSRGINSVTIAEYVMCMLLNITRNNYKFYEAFKRQEWDLNTHLDEIFGKTITIFGMGKVGSEIAKRSKAFGMKVYGVDPVSKENENADKIILPENRMDIIPESDVIVICMPLTETTRNMFTDKEFAAMKETAVFMNVGRGAVINEKDFINAMKNHKIGYAVLDVFEQEPLAPENPLWTLDNIYITPHIAGDRQTSYQPNMMKILCDNLAKYPDFESMTNPVKLNRGF